MGAIGKILWAGFTMLGMMLIAAAQTGPENAKTNIKEWAAEFGFENTPPFMSYSAIDSWATIIGVLLLVVPLIWWLFSRRKTSNMSAELMPLLEAAKMVEDALDGLPFFKAARVAERDPQSPRWIYTEFVSKETEVVDIRGRPAPLKGDLKVLYVERSKVNPLVNKLANQYRNTPMPSSAGALFIGGKNINIRDATMTGVDTAFGFFGTDDVDLTNIKVNGKNSDDK